MHGLEITFALSVMNQRKHEAGAYGLQLEDITQRNPKKKRPSRLPKARMPSTIQKLTGAIMVSERSSGKRYIFVLMFSRHQRLCKSLLNVSIRWAVKPQAWPQGHTSSVSKVCHSSECIQSFPFLILPLDIVE